MATHYRGSRREARALDAFTKLMRAADSVRGRLEPRLRATGLTPSQFGVLEALLHLGPLNQRDLGVKLLVTKGNISVVVDNLEREGLVKRGNDPEDARLAVVGLTPKGRRVIERVFPRILWAILGEFSTLSHREQAALARLCRKLGLGAGRADRHDDGAGPT